MAGSVIKIGLKCEVCNDINYSTQKNPKNMTEKFSTKKLILIKKRYVNNHL